AIFGAYIVCSGCCCSVVGIGGGIVGMILLCVLSISDFDRLAGRTRFQLSPPRPASPFQPGSPFAPPPAADQMPPEDGRK
ncbi:MAG: hypothetical protein ABFC96_09590, partial [Thermoguttaceae bacterium]